MIFGEYMPFDDFLVSTTVILSTIAVIGLIQLYFLVKIREDLKIEYIEEEVFEEEEEDHSSVEPKIVYFEQLLEELGISEEDELDSMLVNSRKDKKDKGPLQ